MGLGIRSRTTYLQIVGDKVCRRVSKDTESAAMRINKNNEEVYELQYDFVRGKIESIETKEGKHGKQWLIALFDGEEHFTLQLPYSGSMSKAFLMAFLNIDLAQSVKLSPSVKEINGKKKSTLFVNQNDKGIKWAFTKDNPNGLPPMEQISYKGVLQWDDSKQLIFLEQKLREKCKAYKNAAPDDIPDELHREMTDEEMDNEKFNNL